jgi:glycosyltransferase involved in cell wall biosynthesis
MVKREKTLGVSIPCYNEVENVVPLCEAVLSVFERELSEYHCVIQFIDNCSTDGTQEKLRGLCERYANVRVILNAKNYRGRSAFYGLLQAEGDGVIYLSADFQDPVEKIPELVRKWEEGYLIVAAVKRTHKENGVMGAFRSGFYNIMRIFSSSKFIKHFCNFGLYDRKFLEILHGLERPSYSIRGNVAEFGYDICIVPYEQQKRRSGKSHYSLMALLNIAIDNFVNYTAIAPRVATITGGFAAVIFLLCAIGTVFVKLLNWHTVEVGFLLCVFLILFTVATNLLMVGILGEYVLLVKRDVANAPLVIERERLNFTKEDV